MTLGNMRSLGVRSLAVTCELCHHGAVLPADEWSDTVLMRTFWGPRMACSRGEFALLRRSLQFRDGMLK